MRASFKSVASFLLIFIALVVHGRSSRILGSDMLSQVMSYTIDVNTASRRYVSLRANSSAATRIPLAAYIVRDFSRLSMDSVYKLIKVFIESSDEEEPPHPQILKNMIFGKIKDDMSRAQCIDLYFRGHSSILPQYYQMTVGEETATREQYKALFTEVLRNGNFSMANSYRLMEVFIDSSIERDQLHSYRLKKMIFERVEADMLVHADVYMDKLLRYHPMVVGEETTTRKRYKKLFTKTMLTGFTEKTAVISTQNLIDILKVVWPTNPALRNQQLISGMLSGSAIYIVTSRVLKERKKAMHVKDLVNIYIAMYGEGDAEENLAGKLLITELEKRIRRKELSVNDYVRLSLIFVERADTVYPDFMHVKDLVGIYIAMHMCRDERAQIWWNSAGNWKAGKLLITELEKRIRRKKLTVNDYVRLSLAFVERADTVYPEFKRTILEATQTAIESDVGNRLNTRNIDSISTLRFAGVSYLTNKDKLSTVNITFVVKVPDDVVELDVDGTGFCESKLKVFRFGKQSKIEKVRMDGHNYRELTPENFGRHFGEAAQRNRIDIYARLGPSKFNTGAVDCIYLH